jgi:hypothetical protein
MFVVALWVPDRIGVWLLVTLTEDKQTDRVGPYCT